jgi:hypothetical protein
MLGWEAPWLSELDGVSFLAETLSRDWTGWRKAEFLEKMPRTWHGAKTEDRGKYVVVRNPGRHRYFEFHFVFGNREGMPVEIVVIRGLNELHDLSIVGKSGHTMYQLKSTNRGCVTRDAQKAAKILQTKYGVKPIVA